MRLMLLLVAGVSSSWAQNEPVPGPVEWEDLHRKTAALIELSVEKGELLQASVFASLQSGYYRSLEQDHRAALAASERALALHRQSGVIENLEISLAAVGRDWMALGEPATALRWFRDARGQQTDPGSKSAGRNARDIVLAELAVGNLLGAREEADRMLPLPTAYRGGAFLAQSDVLFAEQRYGQGLDALGLAKLAGVDEWELASQLLSCVLVAMRSLGYEEAMDLARRMEAEFPGLPVSIRAFARKAITVRRRLAGDIDGVLREQVAELDSARKAKNAPAQRELLRGIATTYRASNSISNEIAALEEALSVEGGSSDFSTLNRLGEAYLLTNEMGKAGRVFNEVLTAKGRRPTAQEYGEAVLGKAGVAAQDDDVEGAREILRKALAGAVPGARFSRVDVLLQMARLERSASWYEQAVAAVRNEVLEVVIRIEFAHFLTTSATGVPDALAQLEVAQRLATKLNLAGSLWRIAYERGIAAEVTGEAGRARALYAKALEMVEASRAGLTEQGQQVAMLDAEPVQDLYRRALGLSTGPLAYDLAERGKARGFLDGVRGKRFRGGLEVAELDAIEQRMAALRVESLPEHQNLLRSAGREPAVLQIEMKKLASQFTLAYERASLLRSRSAQSLTTRPMPLARLQTRLPQGTALIEYAALNDGLLVFVITHQAIRQIRLPIRPGELRQKIQRLRRELADPTSEPELQSVSTMIWTPVERILPGGIAHLIVVATGPLHYLPFQVLPGATGEPLVAKYTIRYLPSASAIEFLADSAKPGGTVFLGAIGNLSVEGWAGLPGTLGETKKIAESYPGARRATGQEFTHDAARAALVDSDVVHFATHGLFDEHAPLFSGLLTAPAAGQRSRLSLYELPEMKLRAKLIILSACETGLGKVTGGDEVAGLTRTFLMAGAETVVSSLWRVSDDATVLLMSGFHARLMKGQRTAGAMREAALVVRAQFAHPFFWAPFVVTGAYYSFPKEILMKLFLMLSLTTVGLLVAETLRIPIDVEQQRRIGEELETAAADGNFATVLLYGRRSLELYPNDPMVQGPIYWVMAEAAQKSGDALQAVELAKIATILDSTLPVRTTKALGTAAPTTRGEKADRFSVALTILAQGVQSYQQVRMQVQQQRMQRQMQQMQQQGVPPPAVYPQQPVAYPQQPAAYPQQPVAYPPTYPQQTGSAVMYPTAPVGDPMYLPNPGPPQPMPGWPQQGQQQQPAPPVGFYPSGPAPYAAPVGYAPPPVPVRGEKAVVYSLIHDHSVIEDSAYFEHSCGVLVSVSGSNLIVTASGGEAPRVIPGGEIREIRVNTAMGRNEGVFHIATKQGLYLSLVPKSLSREDARATVEDLRNRLGLID